MSRKVCAGLKEMSYEQSRQLGKLTEVFNEGDLLTDQQKEVRRLARRHSIALGDAENLRQSFEKYDEDKSGAISKTEFANILKEIIKVRNGEIPQERFDHYWREVDVDQSGTIDFEEFLLWYINVVKSGSLSPESFYATFGVERLQVLNKRRSMALQEQLDKELQQ